MVSFPNAKINLGLNITSKRLDGYHNIESCFYPLPWCDVIEVIPSKELAFTTSGITIPGTSGDNLCLKAYELLREDFDLPPINIHLHKVIPIGAGLGGGSSDASFLLKMLNEKFKLDLSTEKLEFYASKLGSDCPFFIRNEPVIATGTGTEFSPIELDLKGKHVVVIKPDIHVSTVEAYTGIKPGVAKESVEKIIKELPLENWKTQLHNDFEDSIFPKHSSIKELKDYLYNLGAIYASMTGSGAAVYGIFSGPIKIKQKYLLLFFRNYSNSSYPIRNKS